MQHTAIYLHADTDKEWLVKEILNRRFFNGGLLPGSLQGAVYSPDSLLQYIDEEVRHDHIEITTGVNTTLANASSGEQRKAHLTYLLSKCPDFIIVDDVFDTLDKASRQNLSVKLKEISGTTLIIQLLNRRSDILPFIEVVYLLDGKMLMGIQSRETFTEGYTDKNIQSAICNIPSAIHQQEAIKGALIKMNNVSVGYAGRPVLKDICWEINAGEFWQLSGPNGSGKSTLLSMITGDNPKAYGQDIMLFGRPKGSGESVWEIKKKIGYVTPNVAKHFERQETIEQMIIGGVYDTIGLYTKPTDMEVHKASEWLSLLGLTMEKNKPFRLVTAGLQRMILIARAMIKHPPLLILDEPASGLDDESTLLFTALVNQVAGETSAAILYVSHRPEAGLQPKRVFELIPGTGGSTGRANG